MIPQTDELDTAKEVLRQYPDAVSKHIRRESLNEEKLITLTPEQVKKLVDNWAILMKHVEHLEDEWVTLVNTDEWYYSDEELQAEEFKKIEEFDKAQIAIGGVVDILRDQLSAE